MIKIVTMAGTPCPYKGKIGNDAKAAWKIDWESAPEGNATYEKEQKEKDEESTQYHSSEDYDNPDWGD